MQNFTNLKIMIFNKIVYTKIDCIITEQVYTNKVLHKIKIKINSKCEYNVMNLCVIMYWNILDLFIRSEKFYFDITFQWKIIEKKKKKNQFLCHT